MYFCFVTMSCICLSLINCCSVLFLKCILECPTYISLYAYTFYIPINDTTFELSVFWPSDTESRVKELRFSESVSLSFKTRLTSRKVNFKHGTRDEGAQWLSGRVLDSRPKGRGFEPHRRHCVVVLEQDTFILV